MKAIIGNTFPVKDQLKVLGAKWDADSKVWKISDSKFDEAMKIVNGQNSSSNVRKSYFPQKCVVCGAKAQRNARGYSIVKIYRSGECQDCYEERKMGY